MGKYRKKPVEVYAYQWFQNGDHPEDNCVMLENPETGVKFLSEGKVVRRYCVPNMHEDDTCKQCGGSMYEHGWVDTLEGGHIVCPSDFIITGVRGEKYPCKAAIFMETYDLVDKN